jgi:hypothetical protein
VKTYPIKVLVFGLVAAVLVGTLPHVRGRIVPMFVEALLPSPNEGVARSSDVLMPTFVWINALSFSSRLDGGPVPIGSVITAYDPQGTLIGRTPCPGRGNMG